MSGSVERILLLTHDLSFRGASILTLRLAHGLSSKGIQSVVLCTRQKPLDIGLTQKLKIVPVPGYSLPVWGRIVRRTVFHQLAEHPPDVIHVHGPKMLQQGLWLGKALDRPVILNLSDQSEAARVVLSSQSGTCRAIVCVSDSVKAALPARFEQIEQRVILPGVPLDLNQTLPPVLDECRTPVVGMAGPLEVIKGGSFFLRACHRVIDSGTPIRIVITGSGPEEKNLRRLATSLELDDHITFVDDGTAMNAYLSAIDIFCLPSLQQGFGVIMLEAMSLGRPVVASGVGGIMSILEDNRNGLIVPPSDSRALADRILALIKDPERARKIAVEGQNLVEDKFTIDRMIDETVALYDEVATTGSAPVASIPIAVAKGGRS